MRISGTSTRLRFARLVFRSGAPASQPARADPALRFGTCGRLALKKLFFGASPNLDSALSRHTLAVGEQLRKLFRYTLPNCSPLAIICREPFAYIVSCVGSAPQGAHNLESYSMLRIVFFGSFYALIYQLISSNAPTIATDKPCKRRIELFIDMR